MMQKFNLILSFLIIIFIILAILPAQINPFGFKMPGGAAGKVIIYGLAIIFIIFSFIPFFTLLWKGRLDEEILKTLNVWWISALGAGIIFIAFIVILFLFGQKETGRVIGKGISRIIGSILLIILVVFGFKYITNRNIGNKLKGSGLFIGLFTFLIGLFLLMLFILILVGGKDPFGSIGKIAALIIFLLFVVGIISASIVNIIMAFKKRPKIADKKRR